MPQMPVRPFRKTDNETILNAIRNEASTDYQRRIPEATKANIHDTVNALYQYQAQRNEFIDALVNRIGLVLARNTSWSNPLAKFKIGMLSAGDTIEEYAVGLLEAYTYDPDRDYLERDLFGQARPHVKSAFHKVNRSNTYKVTVNESILQRAFLEPNGLHNFIASVMEAPTTSDQWDEFLLMSRLFREYYDANGFFKVNAPDLQALNATEADARGMLKLAREWAPTLGFISTHYNASHMPVAAPIDKLELFLTPRAQATLDVEALAQAFNVDRADVMNRVTIIPPEHMNIPGAQGVLTTTDFFVVADTYMETESQRNAAGRYTNHFFHHDQVISASPFVPAILFTTEEGDVITISDPEIDGVEELSAYHRGNPNLPVTSAERGDYVQIIGNAITDPAGGVNDQISLTLTGQTSSFTFITNTGTLYVGADEAATTLTVTATSTEDPDYTETLALLVYGDRVVRDGLEETVVDYTPIEVTPDAPTEDDPGVVTIPEQEGVTYRVGGSPVTGTVNVPELGSVTVTATANEGYVVATGATVNWTFTDE